MTHLAKPKKIRALIIDDEPLARDGVRLLLKQYDDIEIVGEYGNGRDALAGIKKLKPDLLFLDIQMPVLGGFELLKQVSSPQMPAVIFVTAYDEHAIEAFEIHALDYLLKPINPERFAKTMIRVRKLFTQSDVSGIKEHLERLLAALGNQEATSVSTTKVTKIPVKDGSRTLFVSVETIDWIEAEDYYARLHVGTTSHLIRETLQSLQQRLDPALFLRVHRSSIVNISRVREIRSDHSGEMTLHLHGGRQIKVGRNYRDQIKAILEK